MPRLVGGTFAMRTCINIQPTVKSTLACGLSNGNIILIGVNQELSSSPPGSSFSLGVATAIRNEEVAVTDKRIITAMKWITRQDGTVSGTVLQTLSPDSCRVADPCLLQTGDGPLVHHAHSKYLVAGSHGHQIANPKNLTELIGTTSLLWYRV
jgi:hypothetical protein